MKYSYLICLALVFPGILFSQEPGAEMVFQAYKHTFPEKIRSVQYSGGEWFIQAEETVFAWARGRILPVDISGRWESYRPHSFYPYPGEIPDPGKYNEQQIRELREEINREAKYENLSHHRGFTSILYGGTTRPEIEANLVRISLFGFAVTVHKDIAEPLKRVDRVVKAGAAGDAETVAFLASIASVGGYNWREIQGTSRMSYHSWGLAVDIQPKRLGGKAIYWQWEQARNSDWIVIPLAGRWKPPDPVIRAFEYEGFVWGGKWEFFDTMHFEYRPELHEINRLTAAEQGNTSITADNRSMDIHHVLPAVTEKRRGPFL
ncbi:M15 family metallopeptidase [Breznakiella homolactica]|uniref:M15 family metallopeptidase n=1 Tax=Breznakiella homolactica TaxID=2798577 RepID=A0A7T7XR24_9SPIR|nr:M15 family metallopeptidase [Breznakiella homolactica]QQO10921.1 M15 family metallopeptidase [Breznakiella homolactica]